MCPATPFSGNYKVLSTKTAPFLFTSDFLLIHRAVFGKNLQKYEVNFAHFFHGAIDFALVWCIIVYNKTQNHKTKELILC